VNYVVESLHQDVDQKANVSSAPVHLADVATAAVDADVQVLYAERSLFEQIDAALQRISAGTFGRCTSCGAAIAEERLEALPYTASCARCAQTAEE